MDFVHTEKIKEMYVLISLFIQPVLLHMQFQYHLEVEPPHKSPKENQIFVFNEQNVNPLILWSSL